ncbi:hypothetical protein C0J52_03745 [Blattella germanica]|nr:hypothetical protein C0J52_03745 [Blattella germanica]
MPVTLVKCVEMTLLLLLLLLIRIATNNCEAYSNCTFVYNENQNYSFSRLSKQEVWKVRVYNRSEFAYISVCNRPNNTQYPCKESSFCVSRDSLGTWKIGLSNMSSYKIQQAKQDDSRKFYMKLEGTQPCALDSRKNYSVNIYFKCSRVDDDPKMVERQEDGCMLLITWDTPAACPVVKDCAFGNYDLSSLANPVFYNVSTYDGRLFELSLCGKLPQSSPCYLNDTNLVTACEVIQKSNTSVIIGQNPPALALVPNSGLTLTYKTKKKGSKTIVKLICNMDAEESTPQFTSVVGKTYYFEMETAVACNAFPQECVVS